MTRRGSILWLLMVLVAGVLSLVCCGDQEGTVSGTVTRVETGQVVTEGQVAVFGLTRFEDTAGLDIFEKGDLLRTENLDEAGAFSISLPPGDYVIEAWVPGVAKASNQIRVKSGRVTTVHLEVKTPSE